VLFEVDHLLEHGLARRVEDAHPAEHDPPVRAGSVDIDRVDYT